MVSLGKPVYVICKDPINNTVTLGEEDALYTKTLIAEDVNLISIAEITEPIRVTAKTRYSQEEQPATVTANDSGQLVVTFDTPQRAITSGQAVVFDGDVVIGGGMIV